MNDVKAEVIQLSIEIREDARICGSHKSSIEQIQAAAMRIDKRCDNLREAAIEINTVKE